MVGSLVEAGRRGSAAVEHSTGASRGLAEAGRGSAAVEHCSGALWGRGVLMLVKTADN